MQRRQGPTVPVLDGTVAGAKRTEVGGVVIDEVPAGAVRVKRIMYPPGWRWSNDMRPVSGTEWCEHAHVGFLVQGSMQLRFRDGCEQTFTAPAAVVVEAGHDGWVVGDQAVIMVQVDAATETVERFGLDGLSHHA
jgi:hypothetical protein